MSDDEVRSLHRKMDIIMQAQMEQRSQLDDLRTDFQQAKGVVAFVKWASGFSIAVLALGATFWNSWRN